MLNTYLLCSYFTLGIGYLLYRVALQSRLRPLHAKWVLHSILGLALVVPVWLAKPIVPFRELVAHAETAYPFTSKPVLDAPLSQCYDKAESQAALCHCETLQSSGLLYYRPNRLWDAVAALSRPLVWASGCAAVVLVVLLLLKIRHLQRLQTLGEATPQRMAGIGYWLLRTRASSWLAASFLLRRPYIIWHPDLDTFSSDDQRAILLHEISHLRRRDTWEELLLHCFQWWWVANPAFYAIRRDLRLLNEFIADEYAVQHTGNRKHYARLLLRLKQQQQQHSLVAGFGGGALKARIAELLRSHPYLPTRHLLPLATLVLVLTLGAAQHSAPLVHRQLVYFEEYRILHTQHQSTGKATFCKACLHEEFYWHKGEE